MKRKVYKNTNKFTVMAGIVILLVVMFVIRFVWIEYLGWNEESKDTQTQETGAVEDADASEDTNAAGADSVNNADNAAGADSVNNADNATVEDTYTDSDNHPYDFTVCFAGDINLAENWGTTVFLDSQPNGIKDCISPELMEYMQNADIMCLNNEFTFTTRGEKLEGKLYHFRANPERVEVLKEMGVDIVKLANNHACDYGSQSLLDTMDTLKNAEIEYIGAGSNLQEAMTPVYIEADGKTVAFVAASRAEKNIKTPQATETEPGILRCYETELFIETIKEAKKNADFVLAYVHWGTEYSYELEEVQLTSGKEYLDAGADVVIGAHSHCLQGMEYYEDKPIIYSLGNYWFNEKTLDTMLLELHFSGDDTDKKVEVKVIPAIQAEYKTNIVTDEKEKERIFSFLEDISINVAIDENGLVTKKAE